MFEIDILVMKPRSQTLDVQSAQPGNAARQQNQQTVSDLAQALPIPAMSSNGTAVAAQTSAQVTQCFK